MPAWLQCPRYLNVNKSLPHPVYYQKHEAVAQWLSTKLLTSGSTFDTPSRPGCHPGSTNIQLPEAHLGSLPWFPFFTLNLYYPPK